MSSWFRQFVKRHTWGRFAWWFILNKGLLACYEAPSCVCASFFPMSLFHINMQKISVNFSLLDFHFRFIIHVQTRNRETFLFEWGRGRGDGKLLKSSSFHSPSALQHTQHSMNENNTHNFPLVPQNRKTKFGCVHDAYDAHLPNTPRK